MTIIQKVDAFIEKTDEERDRKIYDYLEPVLNKEFDKVCKKNPRLQRIAWGNGGFVFYFEPERQDDWWDAVEDLHGGNPAHKAPMYARRLIELVCIASDPAGQEGFH